MFFAVVIEEKLYGARRIVVRINGPDRGFDDRFHHRYIAGRSLSYLHNFVDKSASKKLPPADYHRIGESGELRNAGFQNTVLWSILYHR